MSRVILQVPMTQELKLKAETAAKEQGFSSLQETIRVLLKRFAQKKLTLRVVDEAEERLSPKAERRYAKMVEDIKTGKVKTKTFTTVDALMEDLTS